MNERIVNKTLRIPESLQARVGAIRQRAEERGGVHVAEAPLMRRLLEIGADEYERMLTNEEQPKGRKRR